MTNRRLLSLATAAAAVLAFAGFASAGIPAVANCTATSAGGTLYICPQSDGESLGSVGAGVHVRVKDTNGVDIANFPFEDIWMKAKNVTPTTQFNLCQGGLTADANTNVTGETDMTGVPSGGGCNQGPMQVVISGVALPQFGPAPAFNPNELNIRINSPDITGDLNTNLADVGPFSTALNGTFSFCADYFDNGVINLADVGIFSTHLGHTCN